MKIGRPINQLTARALRRLLSDYRRYTDFNRLGLFRGILESQILNPHEKQEIRDLAKETFRKYYDFLVVKDPYTWDRLEHLGENRNRQQEGQDWKEIRRKQEEILRRKRIRHRNFGVYSRHDCGYETCNVNNCMTRPKGPNRYGSEMSFDSDRYKYARKEKSRRHKQQRRRKDWLKEEW
ncbi:hypothetical protein [Neolewinella agarilytica]|uniref:Uncharacterized protein n=1 Tax=Neolewinella agarilytica TaxID=478744 RepID=A0A1H9IYJ7_9BACT|nr:hypothetical protein [Neolewinella agarilytica]SEQ79602.1 hypothetical protein SAMN05444359_1167 [Neolewinella agarilytica]